MIPPGSAPETDGQTGCFTLMYAIGVVVILRDLPQHAKVATSQYWMTKNKTKS